MTCEEIIGYGALGAIVGVGSIITFDWLRMQIQDLGAKVSGHRVKKILTRTSLEEIARDEVRQLGFKAEIKSSSEIYGGQHPYTDPSIKWRSMWDPYDSENPFVEIDADQKTYYLNLHSSPYISARLNLDFPKWNHGVEIQGRFILNPEKTVRKCVREVMDLRGRLQSWKAD